MPTLFGPQGPGGLLSKRIPTLVGLGILAIGVVAGIFLVGQGTGGFLPRAAEGATPKQVRITNISDTGFTVSFITDAASPGYIKYGTAQNALNTQVADDRDQLTGGSGEFTTHHVSVRGLQPNTQYYFQIGTGSRTLFDNQGQPFAVKTATRLESPPAAQTAYGNVLNEVGNPAEGAVVYLSIQGASPLSAMVKGNGSWAVPLSTIRTADLTAAFSLTPDTTVRIQVVGAGREQSIELTVLARDVSPLFDLRFGQEPQPPAGTEALEITDTTGVQEEPSQLGGIFSEEEGNQIDEATAVQITSIEEGETISTDRPEISGTAPANSYIQIEVQSNHAQNGVVQADDSGNWSWTPPDNLEPGSHTVTIMYTDENGVQQQIQRNFIVQASTELPAFTATPSAATPAPTPEPIPEPTPEITPEPTPIPEVQQQPVSGSTNPLLLLGGLSLLFFAVGMWGAKRVYR